LLSDPRAIFAAATRSAVDRAESVAARLRVTISGLDVATAIAVSTGPVIDEAQGLFGDPITTIQMSWEAARHPRLFPLMHAELALYPLTSYETQIDFKGMYRPPMGAIGGAVNALVGHRLAEACVHCFVSDIAHYLRRRVAA
jgi:hypothetical protein